MQSQLEAPFPHFNQTLGKRKIIKNAPHATNVCGKLFSFCEKQEFSDICVISSDDHKFQAHKCVLSAASDFFRAMFKGGLKESSDPEVKIHNVDAKTMGHLLAFMYTGTIELRSESVEDILKAANFFQIKSLVFECYNFMGEELDAKNCLGIAFFAEQHGLLELYKKASKFASTNFENVSKEEEFLKLEEDQLDVIISSKDFSVVSEENVFLSLIKWIDHDKPNRENKAFKLVSRVRYWLLSSNFIKQNRAKLPKEVEYLELICKWLEWHLSPDSVEFNSMKVSKIKRRNNLVAIGQCEKQTFNPKLNTWTTETLPIQLPDGFVKMVKVVNNKIIFSSEESLKCLDLQTKELSDMPPLNVPRRFFGLAVLNDELYVVGGIVPKSWAWRRIVDKFNFSSGKWEAVTPMYTKLDNPQVTVAAGLMYVAGTVSMENKVCIECFNPDSNEWTSKPFNCRLSSFGFTGLDDKFLFIVGGRNKHGGTQNTLHVFDILHEEWTSEIMRLPLSNPKCTSWNNRLIICGGYDDTDTLLNFVQEYNPELKTWRNLAPLSALNYCNEYDILST